MIMWIGRAVDPGILQANFGVPSFDEMDTNAVEVQLMQGQATSKIAQILARVRTERAVPYMQLKIVRCGDAMEPRFFASLIEDRTIGLQSTYTEFLQRMGYRPQQQSQAAPPGAGGAPGGMPGAMPGAAGGMPGAGMPGGMAGAGMP